MAPKVYPIREITSYLSALIEKDQHLSQIWISGEVADLSTSSAGHIYFSLKDGPATLRCVFFRGRNSGQRERISNGISVIVYGSLSVYEPRGDFSFIVEFVQPEGAGPQAAEFERLRALFEEDGLLALERKRPLPIFPHRIGLVTSPTGAVLHDVINVLSRRWPLATVLVQPTPVQGAGAGQQIAQALRTLAEEHRPDVIILARGGGASEDLWAFNEEPVGRAIFASTAPVVSAIGHETDITLADLVADMRAPTPSAAAELVAPNHIEVAQRIDTLFRHSAQYLSHQLLVINEQIRVRTDNLEAALPDLETKHAAVTRTATMVNSTFRRHLDTARQQTITLAGRLSALSPQATLERGYAIVQRADGTLATASTDLEHGETVALRLQDGTRTARIED